MKHPPEFHDEADHRAILRGKPTAARRRMKQAAHKVASMTLWFLLVAAGTAAAAVVWLTIFR